jgi:hypothetical protein
MDKKNIMFERSKHRFDKKIENLIKKINKEQNIAVRSLLISLKNDLVLKKNKIIEKAFSVNYLKRYFELVNEKIIIFNKNAFKENLRIRKNNPDFCILESKLHSEYLGFLFELARNIKMTEVLYYYDEFI